MEGGGRELNPKLRLALNVRLTAAEDSSSVQEALSWDRNRVGDAPDLNLSCSEAH